MIYDLNDVMNGFVDELNKVFGGNTEVGMSLKSDVYEFDDRYEVFTDVPGVTKENINISYKEKSVLIEVNPNEEAKDNLILSERALGKGYKRIYLAKEISFDEAKANLTDGVLKVTLPKKMPKKANIVIE